MHKSGVRRKWKMSKNELRRLLYFQSIKVSLASVLYIFDKMHWLQIWLPLAQVTNKATTRWRYLHCSKLDHKKLQIYKYTNTAYDKVPERPSM